ncbi:MAG: ATP-dependent DNA ligase [Bryobacterales bacterium]|nr:ATP-dependent DNA ligase [Bryobacterales bacterium]
MKDFAALYSMLDETTKTNAKIEALAGYFQKAAPADAAWAVSFLIGRKPKRLIEVRKLAEWASREAGVPDWMFGECYQAVGDLAETIALLLPPAAGSTTLPLHFWVEERLLPLQQLEEAAQRELMLEAWRGMDDRQRLVWNKLITGAFRVGVSQNLVVRGLSAATGLDAAVLAHRLMGDWQPTPQFWETFIGIERRDEDVSRPYPFCLAHPLDGPVEELGPIAEWQAEWKWDGIRAQLVRRQRRTYLWSRGEELITDRFPEIEAAGSVLADGAVLDGEILPWKHGLPLPFAQMQRRVGRKIITDRILSEVPVVLLAFDLLELDGEDVRERELRWRRARLEEVAAPAAPGILLSPLVEAASWEELAARRTEARRRHVEGLMLKRRESPYRVGRRRGDWWKWKIQPYAVDAVLIYAQPGNGRRASLFTDYTFGVWEGGQLVPFAKAYSGLTDEEIRRVDAFVRANTQARHGPVRAVKPELVFELHFEGIQRSGRHRSGVAVRFPRIARWRTDKKPEDADTVETIKALLPPQ